MTHAGSVCYNAKNMAMDEDKYQKELFEFEKPKRFFPRISDLFPKADFERNVAITLTLDKVVFIAIGIVMLMVVIYALGVEAGKNRRLEPLRSQAVPTQVPVSVPVATVPVAARPVSAQQARAVLPQKSSVAIGQYTILAATFNNKDNALQEVRKLRLQGLDAMLMQRDSRFFVCVGSYQDKGSAEAQNNLKKVRRFHSDAYLRIK